MYSVFHNRPRFYKFSEMLVTCNENYITVFARNFSYRDNVFSH